MKLSQWAKKNSLTYTAAYRQFKKGLIPKAYQLVTGTIVVPDEKPKVKGKTAVYARVSSSDQRKDLDRQADRLVQYCNVNGWGVDVIYKEVASGLNDKRKRLVLMLEDKSVTRIVVEHKDRLSRFGVNYIEVLLKNEDRELVIVNSVNGDEEDLMQDFISLITSFCARIYGSRRSKRKTAQIVEQLRD
ncbi:MAG: IS607 family transposase [Chitinophagales bacterium]